MQARTKTSNVGIKTFKSFRVTTNVVEKQEQLNILSAKVCSIDYHKRKAHAPYVVCGLSGFIIFFHII